MRLTGTERLNALAYSPRRHHHDCRTSCLYHGSCHHRQPRTAAALAGRADFLSGCRLPMDIPSDPTDRLDQERQRAAAESLNLYLHLRFPWQTNP